MLLLDKEEIKQMIFRAAALKVNSPECEGVEQFVWERERVIADPESTIFKIAELKDAILGFGAL